jgi:predicted regulator of Ras-like GTPase activity (Roadblock/LC7/MglB family)
MSLSERLNDLLSVRGVRSASVASLDGFVLEAVGPDAGEGEAIAGLVAGALASSRALAELFGDGELRQATIEYERGPVLLAPLPAPAGEHVAVLVLDDLAALGRARLALRRVRDALAQAVAT